MTTAWPRPMRAAAAPLVLLLLGFPAYELVTALRQAVSAVRPLRQMGLPAPDAATDRAYETLAASLPPAGRIGFVREPMGPAADFAASVMFLQYSLAPRLVVASWEPDVVLVQGDTTKLAATLQQHSLEMTHDLGGGWRVFRRTHR
jgi:hypothetical protein